MDYKTKLLANVKLCEPGCWEWQAQREAAGYGRTRYNGRMWLAHRLAWTLFRGPIRKGRLVCHKCDNPPCCNPDHLFIGTYRDNTQDSIAKGRRVASDAAFNASKKFRRVRLLSDAQVAEIRTSSESCKTLADRMSCTYHNVYMIRNGTRKIAPVRPVSTLEVEWAD